MAHTLERAERFEAEAQKKYWKDVKNTPTLRQTFLESKANEIALHKGRDSAKTLLQLQQQEKQREAAREIRYAMNKIKPGGVSTVEVTENGHSRELKTQREIDRAGVVENWKKITQTNETPCMQLPLREMLGTRGNTPLIQQIIEGTATIPASVPPYSQEFLQQLKKHDNVTLNEVPAYYSTNEYIEGWSKINKKISSGKSGRHYRHMKVFCRR